jgi:hypothetical protein
LYPLPLNCLDPLPFHAAVRYVEAKHVVRTGSTSSALLLKSESSLPVAGAFAVFFMGIELSVCKCRPLLFHAFYPLSRCFVLCGCILRRSYSFLHTRPLVVIYASCVLVAVPTPKHVVAFSLNTLMNRVWRWR